MKIAIIGAGPAGIYLALFLKQVSGKIFLYEKNAEIGKKLKITGGGKMNIGNRNFSEKHFTSTEKNILKNILKNPHARNILQLFTKIGTKYKFEENRAILENENAIQEVQRLENLLNKQQNFQLITNNKIQKIEKEKELFLIENQKFDYVIVTSGSQVCLSENLTKEEAYALPHSLGHSTTKIEPALCPLILEKGFFKGLEGISLTCKITNPFNKTKITNKIIFTHQGISGPAVLDFTMQNIKNEIEINFLPDLKKEDFGFLIEKNRKGKIFLKKVLWEYLPKRMVFWLLEKTGIEENKIVANLSKKEAKKLFENIFELKIKNIKKAPIQTGWTVRGGVNLKEIYPATLESKIHKNLFFAGEILDVTGMCGGFNLSFAILSAKIVSERIREMS